MTDGGERERGAAAEGRETLTRELLFMQIRRPFLSFQLHELHPVIQNHFSLLLLSASAAAAVAALS